MFKLEFSTDNEAFQPNPRMEITAILRHIAKKVDEGETGGKVMDGNGNSVGRWSYVDE